MRSHRCDLVVSHATWPVVVLLGNFLPNQEGKRETINKLWTEKYACSERGNITLHPRPCCGHVFLCGANLYDHAKINNLVYTCIQVSIRIENMPACTALQEIDSYS